MQTQRGGRRPLERDGLRPRQEAQFVPGSDQHGRIWKSPVPMEVRAEGWGEHGEHLAFTIDAAFQYFASNRLVSRAVQQDCFAVTYPIDISLPTGSRSFGSVNFGTYDEPVVRAGENVVMGRVAHA